MEQTTARTASATRRGGEVPRLIVALLFFLLALLALLPAPTFLFWQLAVLATEWGYGLALVGLLLLWPGWQRSRRGRVAALLALAGILLLLSPLLRAIPLAQRLPAELQQAFGSVDLNRAPLSAADLLRGINGETVESRRLVYATVAGSDLALDFYPAARESGAPLVIVIHGGSWSGGDSSQLAPLNSYLATRGYAVAAINYRLLPRWPYPAAGEDVLAALQFLKNNAAERGIDPARIVLLGRSAGAQLALAAAYTANDPAIRGAISFYGPVDLRYGYANPANPLVIDSRDTLEAYLGGSPEQVPQAYDRASPSRWLAELLATLDRPHLLVELPWATHGFDFNVPGPGGQISTYAVEYFLAVVNQ
jgi:acetyl esterase/lipase